MTDKTPEGRKSDTMPLNCAREHQQPCARCANLFMRETADKISLSWSLAIAGVYGKAISSTSLRDAIEQALLQSEQEGFERGVKTSAQAIEDICYSHVEHMAATSQELFEDVGAQQAKLQVLSLLNPREKSRIEREGK